MEGALKLTDEDRPADAVLKAGDHIDELLSKLKEFQAYLRRSHGGFFHEAAMKINRYLSILEPYKAEGNRNA